MPPSFSGGLSCARAPGTTAVLAAMDSHKPRTLERNRFMEAPWQRAALACGLTLCCRDHAASAAQRQAAARPCPFAYSAKRKVRTGPEYAKFGACRNRSDQVRRPRKRVGLSLAATTSAK